jgi:hypothetical protein
MPIPLLAAKLPIFVDDHQYDYVDCSYELVHREAMLFVVLSETKSIVKDAGKALVPDVARYGASSH